MKTSIIVAVVILLSACAVSQEKATIQREEQTVPTQNRPSQEQIERRISEMFRTDFAGLRRYREANNLIQPPVTGENRVVFMGNSITELWETVDSTFFTRNRSFINRGIGGQTTPQMLIRFRNDVINLRPSVVVILAGTNDIAGNTGPSRLEDIYGNIVSMAELAMANNVKVVLCSVLPVNDYPWRPGLEPADKILNLNTMLSEYAGRHGLIYVDYHTPMADERNGLKKEFSEDGVHPNLNGYKVMEELILAAIAKVK
ncbi:MAG TPA: SGNH/GDSL hydrolase family protein [Methanospirillum sp.]|jgi:lysophospholipase L1-like esterase|uniref:SGNH/GDSL hydrolase family protein n=1 Tax=Methanospirillum sp. TaxID=45200 RepID=UPI002B8D48D3|nr:SGNH/GDSL hydrolase family protein [Methanospirillum sp.]HPQ28596.1 SGNH/GDSL hydrolase family protein [Desulfobacteraceae bacterium]HPY61471.1 SGNH/GDSL hydrolase family protein [Methanospirillum sp.]